MKKIILLLTAIIGITIVTSGFATIPKHKFATKKINKKAKFSTVNLTATNSTSDGVYVTLQNNTSGGSYSFFIPPNTPNGTVLGQIPEVYWEHKSNVTGLSVSGMSIGCQACAKIQIF